MLLALVALGSACGTARFRAGLAFTRYVSPDDSSVWVARADGSGAREIAPDGFAGKLSPDGRRVAYSVARERGGGLPSLFVRDVAGGEARPIGEAREYAWSPDSTRLAVSDGKAVVLVDVKSGGRRELASGGGGGFSFAPESTALAYARTNGKVGHEYRSDIFVIRLSDREARRLTDDGHSDRPVWGGDWLVYRSFHFDHEWSIGRLRLMRPDGSGRRMFARGDERTSLARMGLDPLALSRDGKRLLACAAAEFGCPPVTFAVPDGERYTLPIREDRTAHELATAADLARDGTQVLVDVGPFDGPMNHRVYAIPFEGGKPRLIARDATAPSWAH